MGEHVQCECEPTYFGCDGDHDIEESNDDIYFEYCKNPATETVIVDGIEFEVCADCAKYQIEEKGAARPPQPAAPEG